MAKLFSDLLNAWAPVLALILQAMVLSRFLERKNRRYPLAIFYCLFLFLLTSLAILWSQKIAWVVDLFPPNTRNVTVMGGLEVFMHVLLLIFMLQLLSYTLGKLALPKGSVAVLGALSALVFLGAAYWVKELPVTTQFTKLRQVMSFWMVLINLYWWTLLLRQKGVGRQVLLLSTGIGLQLTGQVISDGLFGLMKGPEQMWLYCLALVVMFGTHFVSLIAWYEAFHPKNAEAMASSVGNGMALPKTQR